MINFLKVPALHGRQFCPLPFLQYHQLPCVQTLKKVFISPPLGFVRGEANTIGHLAERNTERLGRYEKEDKKFQDKFKQGLSKEQKQRREMHQSIISMTPEQKVNYIKTGKKPSG